MKVLGVAIFTRYNVSPDGDALRAATTGLFPQDAPQGTSTIYVTHTEISNTHSWYMSPDKKRIREVLIQFGAWTDDDNPDAVSDVGELIIDLYESALLTVTGFATIRADVIGEGLLPDLDNKGFQYFVEVRYRLEENR